jgi:beta-1,4-N-acetylglucosaminyltransferase
MATHSRRTGRELLLVCSSGGHLQQLHALRPAWEPYSRLWVTFDRSDARALLVGEEVVYAYGPTNRSLRKLARNLLLAIRLIRRERPRVLLTTGAGVCVPFAWAGRMFGCKVVYVESATRIDVPSLSLRLVRPVAHRIYVQWPELQRRVRSARYHGSVLDPA